ncbi:MAG TPA: peptidylprolyl isomerase [Phycisphaerae bacterium]|nr:peptidylprolyl isomerase [Phycisphaerae bacterium]
MKRLLHEPLLHFTLIGAALFAVFRYVQPAREPAPSSKEIRLSLDDLGQLVLVFQAQWKRQPTAEEFARLVENKVQEEVLYREGLEMGLDREDTIVKRRMAQKMQFLAEDTAAAREPTNAELRTWYAKYSDKFAMPRRISFRHLYFSPDRRGERARDDAAKAMAQLGGQSEDVQLPDSFADSFMSQEYYRDRAPDYLGKEFGPQFAQAVANLPIGSWQGPIESGFGWHLVFVDTAIPGRVPDFEEVEPDVKTAWLGEQKALAWQKAYQELRAKYTVLVPEPPESASTAAAPSADATAAASGPLSGGAQ